MAVEDLMNKLLEASPTLTREDIEARIRAKKDKIGAGYLNDEGALFLVASDEGIDLSESLDTQSTIKDLHAGAKGVTMNVKVMSISPSREFTTRDGRPLKMRTMVVYDADGSCTAKIWDLLAEEPILDTLEPGDSIKITGAYIKSDIGGSPVINLGTDGAIDAIDALSDIPGVEAMAKDVGEMTEGDKDVAVSGVLDGMLATMNFNDSQGQARKALRMRLRSVGGESFRTIIWGQDDEAVPKMIPPGAKIHLLGVRSKQTGQGLEVHGNESTIIKTAGSDTIEPLKFRVLSKVQGDRGGNMLLCVDAAKDTYFVSDGSNHSAECSVGDVIECMPTKAYGKSIKLDEDAYLRRMEDDSAMPKLEDIRTKLEETNPGDDYCVVVTVLKDPVVRDIQTRSGETIQLLEIFACDDTGEAWIKGWRNQARLADKCQKGSVVSVTGVNARHGMDGRVDLMLTAYSTIASLASPSTP